MWGVGGRGKGGGERGEWVGGAREESQVEGEGSGEENVIVLSPYERDRGRVGRAAPATAARRPPPSRGRRDRRQAPFANAAVAAVRSRRAPNGRNDNQICIGQRGYTRSKKRTKKKQTKNTKKLEPVVS